MLVGLIAYMFFVVTMDCKVKIMQRAKNSENTSPYMRVRLRKKRNPGKPYPCVNPNTPMWVQVLYGGQWRRIKLCKNKNEDIDVLVRIAGKMRGV